VANVQAALRRIRRTRNGLDEPTSDRFSQHRPAYEAALGAVGTLAGDEAFDELRRWMVESTERHRKLPAPAAVRKRGRELCRDRGVVIPDDSPLHG